MVAPKMSFLFFLCNYFILRVNCLNGSYQGETSNESHKNAKDLIHPTNDNALGMDFYNTAPHVRHLDSKRFFSKHEFSPDWYSNPYPMEFKYCQRSARCQQLNYSTCMGSTLPYYVTTLNLTDLSSQEKVQVKLHQYQYLRYIPKCWAVIQPFLCALYMPKCENNIVDLPSKEMCRITQNPCKILFNTTFFSELMNCDNEELFPSKCKNDIHEVKFNTTGLCMDPLVRTDQPEWYFPDVDGCGVQCKDILFTEDEHQQVQRLIGYCSVFCIILNLYTIVTFLIDWKIANKYPALAIFYINVCFVISYCGWLMQFLGSETKHDIVCKKDGTLRRHEPSANENLSCVSVFVMIYYFIIAGMVWFVIFIYAWYMSSLQALGKTQERVDKKRAYFHLAAWSLPLIFTITTMALGEIDGDYVLGICFVSFTNLSARICLLLLPLGATIITAGVIVIRGLILLMRVKITSRDVISEHSSSKIRSNIVRMGVFILFMIVFCVITFVYHGYIFTNTNIWQESLENYVLCKLTTLSPDVSHCTIEKKPSVSMLQLQLLAVFGSGVGMASWVWCASTYYVWIRFIKRKLKREIDEPLKFQKHKIIAQAFEKRKIYKEGHEISIEPQQHTDPVGLHFDLNSGASNELSSMWKKSLSRFVYRRGAVPEVVICSQSSNSEMSYSLQQISIESKCNSGDSHISELATKINSYVHKKRVRRKKNLSRGSRDFMRQSHSKISRKGSSTTSLDSHFGMHLLNIFSKTTDNKSIEPNLTKRRMANAGLDEQSVNSLLANVGPIVSHQKQIQTSESEDEKMSVTISESKFAVIVNSQSNNNLDLSDQLIIKSLRQDLHVKDINCSNDYFSKARKNNLRETDYSDDTGSDTSSSGNSAYPELKQLLQSSFNSVSTASQTRCSKLSKTSVDVAVQANAQEIVKQTSALNIKNDGFDVEVKDVSENMLKRKIKKLRNRRRL